MKTLPRFTFRLQLAAITLAMFGVPTMLAPAQALAQTNTVLYSFTGGQDGKYPYTGLTMDTAGDLYGTTNQGGDTGGSCAALNGCGTVFKLARRGSGWIFAPLYVFQGVNDGIQPAGRVAIGPDGSLYGTTMQGGQGECNGYGCGTIFNLKPPPAACHSALCPWTKTVVYYFTGQSDGGLPAGDLIFDQQGNIYGKSSAGTYKLTSSNGGWSFSLISDWVSPNGVTFDQAGNLYGANSSGVFQLTPSPSGWVASVLGTFDYDAGYGPTGVVFDRAGNLYGGNCCSQNNGQGGTVWQVSPFNGGWTLTTIYIFSGNEAGGPSDGSLVFDAAGNLWGTTSFDGANGDGNVFRMTPSNGGWTYSDIYDFSESGGGLFPNNSLVFDSSGNLYGTTVEGGSRGVGVVFELTP